MSVAEKLTTVAQNVSKVYATGKESGYDVGMAEGATAERIRFMNAYTNDNTRTNFDYAFYGRGWTDDTFYLPFVIKPERASYMFQNSKITNVETIKNIDFSGCIGITRTFAGARIEELGVLDFSNILVGFNGLNQTFHSANKLWKIELLIFPTAAQNLLGFSGCTSLIYIRFSGIAYQSISFAESPLEKASIESLFPCLSDDVSGQAATFSLDAVNAAFETSVGAADGSESEEWLALVATKPNWTINLV